MATLSPAAQPKAEQQRKTRRWLLIGAVMFLTVACVGCTYISANWPYRYRKIRPLLEEDLASQVEVQSYH